jgi:hypothetical protein
MCGRVTLYIIASTTGKVYRTKVPVFSCLYPYSSTGRTGKHRELAKSIGLVKPPWKSVSGQSSPENEAIEGWVGGCRATIEIAHKRDKARRARVFSISQNGIEMLPLALQPPRNEATAGHGNVEDSRPYLDAWLGPHPTVRWLSQPSSATGSNR